MITPWLERTFPTGIPADLHPNLRARLRGTPARLDELVRSADMSSLTAGAAEEWTVLDHAGHLGDLDHLFDARLDDFAAGRETLTPWDGVNRRTEEARHRERPVADVLAYVRRTRGQILARLDALDTASYEATALHPRLQTPMRLIDLLHFFAEHDDHHLARIDERLRG